MYSACLIKNVSFILFFQVIFFKKEFHLKEYFIVYVQVISIWIIHWHLVKYQIFKLKKTLNFLKFKFYTLELSTDPIPRINIYLSLHPLKPTNHRSPIYIRLKKWNSQINLQQKLFSVSKQTKNNPPISSCVLGCAYRTGQLISVLKTAVLYSGTQKFLQDLTRLGFWLECS